MSQRFTRKQFLKLIGLGSAAVTLGSAQGCNHVTAKSTDGEIKSVSTWNSGSIAHLIPSANHDRFLIKASFTDALNAPPALEIGGRKIPGQMTDTEGRFWQFDVTDLDPNTEYGLQILDHNAVPICDSWPLKTFPHPEQSVPRLRILAYTCAGGDESIVIDGAHTFIPVEQRQALLEHGLSFEPDVVIANGDHIYWDERTMTRNKPPQVIEAWRKIQEELGSMDRNEPILGGQNEAVLKRVGDRQIARLYGTRLRSLPTYMLTDDHDLFENDEATEDLITLPPDTHMLEAARTAQSMYYPEFLPDATRPQDLPGSAASDRPAGLSEVFGTLRYGSLFEALLYDTKRYVSLEGDSATMVPLPVEHWLKERTAENDTLHLAHIPSTPIGWSAGKWGEWYPDMASDSKQLTLDREKPYWPRGWWEQHQRLLKSLSDQHERKPLIMCGDLHMFAAQSITRSADLDFSDNPINSVVVGPLGTGRPAFPSAARGVMPQTPNELMASQVQEPVEKNGFTIIDVTESEISFEMYAWREPEPVAGIENMKPLRRFSISR